MANLLYFGKLVEITRHAQEKIDLPPTLSTTDDLRKWIDERLESEGLFLEPTIRIAINNEIVIEPHAINQSDEIAFMPPVGGG